MRVLLTLLLTALPTLGWAQTCPTYGGNTYCGNSLGVTSQLDQNASGYRFEGNGDPLNQRRTSDAVEPQKFMRYGQTCEQIGNTVSCE